MEQIVTLTMNPTIDKNTEVDHVVPERKLRCERPRREPGGGGLNVSRAIHRLGGTSTAVYVAGGPTGDVLQTLLDEEGLQHHPIAIEDWTRENVIVYETTTDQQFRFGMPGPALQEDEWERCLEDLADRLAGVAYLVASGSLPPGVPDSFFARLARLAHRTDTRLVVDTSGSALRQAAQEGVYLLKPNLRELAELMEQESIDEARMEAAAKALIGRGACDVVVLSMGASGALLVTSDRCRHLRSPTVSIKSRVGAGDSMVGGLVLALARGLDLPDAARFGIAAGAAAVMTPGTELCRRDDTERLYEQLRDG